MLRIVCLAAIVTSALASTLSIASTTATHYHLASTSASSTLPSIHDIVSPLHGIVTDPPPPAAPVPDLFSHPSLSLFIAVLADTTPPLPLTSKYMDTLFLNKDYEVDAQGAGGIERIVKASDFTGQAAGKSLADDLAMLSAFTADLEEGSKEKDTKTMKKGAVVVTCLYRLSGSELTVAAAQIDAALATLFETAARVGSRGATYQFLNTDTLTASINRRLGVRVTGDPVKSPLSMPQIALYQICLWVGVALILVVLSVVCMFGNMNLNMDPMLMAKFNCGDGGKFD